MILPKERDPRFITIRRGGTLTDLDYQRLAWWAGESAGRRECQWQREQLPEAIRELVLDDQRLRNDICWSVFDC